MNIIARKIINKSNKSFLQQAIPKSSSSSPPKATRSFSRGSRGHGWWINYRAGKGGRHLQGDYYDVNIAEQQAWNDAVFALGSQKVFMDILVGPIHSTQQQQQDTSNATDDSNNQSVTNRLIIELATTVLPKATDNFIQLLQTEIDGYKSSTLHRVEKKVGLLGGNVVNDYKTGKCFEPYRMADSFTSMKQTEHMVLSHVPGIVTMLSQRVQEIDSRFMLCSHHAPHLDGMALAIGRLSDESLKQVQEWEGTLITRQGFPTTLSLRVVNGGLVTDDDNQNVTTTATTTTTTEGSIIQESA